MKNLFILFCFLSFAAFGQTADYTLSSNNADIDVYSVHDKTILFQSYDTLSGTNDTLIISFPQAFPANYKYTLCSTWLASGTTTDSSVRLQGRNASYESWNNVSSANELDTEGITESDSGVSLDYIYLRLVCTSASGVAHLKTTLLLQRP